MAQQRYKVIERIDAGGMAEVFKANSTSMQGFQKLVAIKRILPNLTQNERFVRMFLDEAKVSLHLNHTNCVHVFDLGIADGSYFIVMEFVDGTNLKKLIEFLHRHDHSMPVEQAVFVAIEVCKGLTHAHEMHDQQGNSLDIVHRDISPPNVLLSKAGEIKITDFGLAKAKSQAEATDPGVVKGKFGYLSPEAAHGEEVDARTDIFAVGILLWEMLAGERLFLGESDYDTLQLVRAAKIPDIRRHRPDVPDALNRILLRALTRDVDQRYATAQALGEDLADFLFSYGRRVTSYDLADLVDQFRDKRPRRRQTAHDEAIGAAVQQQLDKLKSLEEIEDLDMYLAQHYDSLPDQGEVSNSGQHGFEDPRMWADLGFGGGSQPPAPSDSGEIDTIDRDRESWEEAGLDDIARSTSAYDAIDPDSLGDDVATAPAAPATRQKQRAQKPRRNPKPQRSEKPNRTQQPARRKKAAPQQAPAQRQQPAQQQPASPQQPSSQSSDDDSSLSPVVLSVLVALIVVALGIGAGFALGLLPPS